MLLMLILYRVLLDLVYVQCITGVYAYMGMSCEKPELFQAILYWIVYLCFSLWCIRLSRGSHLSELVLMFLFLTSFAPAMTMFTYRKADHSFLYILYWLCLAVLHLAIPPRSKKHRIQAGDKAVRIVSYACLALSLFIWGFYAHFHIQISLTDVYDQRAAAREYGMPTIVTYLYGSLNVIIPTFVIYALKNKKKLEAALFFLAQLAIFFTNGSKSTFFLAIFSLFLYFFVRNNTERTRYLPHILSLGVLAGFLAEKLLRIGLINSLVIRRLMFIPVTLDYVYYDFFSTHSPDLFRSSLLSHFGFSSIYDKPIPRLLGEIYPNIGFNANNGLFSDAYANLGVIGMFAMPLLIVLLLRLGDRCSSGLDRSQLMPVMIAFYVLSGSSFFTNLLTHGLVVLFIVLYLLPRTAASPERKAVSEGAGPELRMPGVLRFRSGAR